MVSSYIFSKRFFMKRQKLSHAKVLSITKKEYGFDGFNNWRSRNKFNFIKNAHPPFLINKVIKKCLEYKFSSNQN